MLLLLVMACTPGTVDGPAGAPPKTTADTGTPSPAATGSEIVSFAGAPPTNVLIVSIDTVRRDRVGRYGGTNTPFLDELFRQSVVLDNHRSCSDWTAPSMACALTGLFPPLHDFWPNTSGMDGVVSLPDGVQSVPLLLGAKGSSTRLVSANPTLTGLHRLADGYDEVILEFWAGANMVKSSGLAELDEMIALGAPWLLHLHYMDPHVPYCPPEEYRMPLDALPEFEFDLCNELPQAIGAWLTATPEWRAEMQAQVDVLYDGEIQFVDANLSSLWDELEARGALDDTLVLVLSDHGEQFYEHLGHGHAIELHGEENLAVAAFWAPGLAPATWSGPTTHVDLFATLASVYDLVPEVPTDGIPIGLAPADRVRLSTQLHPPLTALNADTWSPAKFAAVGPTHVLHTDWDGRFQLYDLTTDPGELTDLYTADDPAVAPLWSALEPLVDLVQTQWPALENDEPTP
jgi:arylsulfatase A-like enzyme